MTEPMTTERARLKLWLTEMTLAVFSDDDDLSNTGLYRYQLVITQPRHDQTRYLPRVLIFSRGRHDPNRVVQPSYLVGTAPLMSYATIQGAIDAGLRWCEDHARQYAEEVTA